MQQYNPPRKKKLFEKGKPFDFSRSKVDSFIKCPRCFYLDRVLGIDTPPGFPFNINSAVDSLLKKEFDVYREKNVPHPIIISNGFDFIPFNNSEIDAWRSNFDGIRASYKNYTFSGAVDDIWINKENELIVVDYKSTANSKPVIALDKDFHEGYKRQIEFYQWLLLKNGFKVSELTVFVYCTGDNTKDSFENKVIFQTNLITHIGNTSWIEPTLDKLIATAESEEIPQSNENCDICKYYNARQRVKFNSLD